MTGQVLSIILDIAVLIGLGFTIFYCFKLSRSMNSFRQHKGEMNKLIDRLSKNIDEALRAIDGLKLAGDKSGRELQKYINESKAMADELQMVNEASNSLASRLENLADRTKLAPQTYDAAETYIPDQPSRPPTSTKQPFMIQDREYGDDFGTDNEDIPEGLQSQAEKELLEALRRNKKPSRGAF